MATTPPKRRRRSSSVLQYIAQAPSDTEHHLSHLSQPSDEQHADSDVATPLPDVTRPPPLRRQLSRQSSSTNVNKTVRKPAPVIQYGPPALRWVSSPADCFLVLGTIFSLWAIWRQFVPPASPTTRNPFDSFLFVQHDVGWPFGDDGRGPRYAKGWRDVLFVAYWIVVFSFLRQTLTASPIRALGVRWGLKKRKLERFQEQGYAVCYFAASTACGLYVMRQQDSWWYRTEHFWLEYPKHWAMTWSVKTYYLTQFAYWLQQALVMIAGLEKPRDDYIELIIHHCVTAWLIGASYTVNLTQIGIAVYFSMDAPDLMLAISKCINYVGLERTSEASFVAFMITWGYLRHYENIRMLYSVWTQFTLIPAYARVWDPPNGFWLPSWMRYQIFAPIFALQLLNAFWSYLILRVVARMFTGRGATDVREHDDETGYSSAGGTDGGLKVPTRKDEARSRSRSGTMDSISELPAHASNEGGVVEAADGEMAARATGMQTRSAASRRA